MNRFFKYPSFSFSNSFLQSYTMSILPYADWHKLELSSRPSVSEKSDASIRHQLYPTIKAESSTGGKECSLDPVMERISDLDTTNIFPGLNFNVRTI